MMLVCTMDSYKVTKPIEVLSILLKCNDKEDCLEEEPSPLNIPCTDSRYL